MRHDIELTVRDVKASWWRHGILEVDLATPLIMPRAGQTVIVLHDGAGYVGKGHVAHVQKLHFQNKIRLRVQRPKRRKQR